MHTRTIAAFLAAGALFAANTAQAQPKGQADCLRVGQIDSFSAIKGNERAFLVTDRLHRRFRVNLMSRCGGLDYNMAVGFKTLETGRLACIQRGDTVLSRDPGVAGNRCPISSVEPYTAAMEAADKAAAAR